MYSVKLSKIVQAFQMTVVLPEINLEDRVLTRKEINRPALQLTGFYDRFDKERLQLIGLVEHSYLASLTSQERDYAIAKLFERLVPGVVLSKNLEPFEEMIYYAKKFQVPIFRTKTSTTDFAAEIIMWLRDELADRIMMHGVLVDIYGEGVLITGNSGIGKSETALELIKRGHRLIADDAVEIKKIADKTLVGTCPELIRYLIELRGIGIINVKELFGIGAVKQKQVIDMVLQLEIWDGERCMYDRLGLNDDYIEILNNKVLCRTIPIRPGRNVAVICESAAISNRQKKMGQNTALDFEQTVMDKNRNSSV